MTPRPKRPRGAEVNRTEHTHEFQPLPHLALHVLLALADQDLHGWGIVKRIAELTGGRTKPSTGSLYLSIIKLEERGLVAPTKRRDHDDDPRRRYYTLSRLGRSVLEAETRRLSVLVDHARRAGIKVGRTARP